MFDPRFVDFSAGVDYLSLCGLPILVDVDDYEGIHIAVENLAVDIEKVTGTKPETWTDTDKSEVDGMIVVGSLEKSRFARELAETGGSKADTIRGKWECFATNVQQSPWHCAKRLLAITGSDKRGTIFGVYTLSEQIGVSP